MSEIIVKEAGKFETLYIMNAVLYFPEIIKPKVNPKSGELQYSVIAFIDGDSREKLESHTDDGGIFVNKVIAEVGVDKNKKRKFKYPTSDQVEEGKFNYDDVKGLHGISLTAPDVKKNGEKTEVVVKDTDGNEITAPVGNGSKGNIRLWGYRNAEGQLNITLSAVQITEFVEGFSGAGGFDDVLGMSLDTNKPTTNNEPEPDFDDESDEVKF